MYLDLKLELSKIKNHKIVYKMIFVNKFIQ